MNKILLLIALFLFVGCDLGKSTDPTEKDDDFNGTPNPSIALFAPDSVWITAVTDSGVMVSWNSAEDAQSYLVYVDGSGERASFGSPDTMHFVAFPGISTYRITVVTVNGRDTSAQNDQITLLFNNVRVGQPPNVRALGKTSTSFTIGWDNNDEVDAETGYIAYLRDENYEVIDSAVVDTTVYEVTFTGLLPNKAYKYNVATITDMGVGPLDSSIACDSAILTTQYNQFFDHKLPHGYASTYSAPQTYSGDYAGEMRGVAGGLFPMGCVWADFILDVGREEKPVHEVLLSSFFLGTYEITNEQLLPFLNDLNVTLQDDEGMWGDDSIISLRYPATCGFAYDTINDTFTVIDGRADWPVACLYWTGAAQFCNWVSEKENLQPCYDTSDWECDYTKNGYRLPTEAEFEYVSSGAFTGYKQRFPWGYHFSDRPADLELDVIGSVGSGINSYGWHEIAGNVQEYLNDRSEAVALNGSSAYYAACAESGVVENPKGPAEGDYHMMRSGSFETVGTRGSTLISSWRYTLPCSNPSDYGMRLARGVQ